MLYTISPLLSESASVAVILSTGCLLCTTPSGNVIKYGALVKIGELSLLSVMVMLILLGENRNGTPEKIKVQGNNHTPDKP